MANSPKFRRDTATLAANRRRVPRYSFVATAEIAQAGSGAKTSGRVSEISRYGCFIDIAFTFPVDTLIEIRVSCDDGVFATKGKVLYVQERIGMGMIFLDTPNDQLEVLDSWLAKLTPYSTP